MSDKNEIEIRIVLTKKQREFHQTIKRHKVVLYGGGRGGGKSHGLRLILLLRRFLYPGSIGYLFRKTFPELLKNHINPLFKQFPKLRRFYNSGTRTLTLPNGSQLIFAYAQTVDDVEKFQGQEIHDLAIEEAGNWPEEWFQMLRASNRSGDPAIPARTFLTANPAGSGHKWLKRLFVDRKYLPDEDAGDYHFIPSLVGDNPALKKSDPEYVKNLKSIKSVVLRKAWIEGDWNVQAGQFFSEFSTSVHVVKPFKIPIHWSWFGAYDYGFNHPAVWGWFATDQDGNVYLVHEIAKARVHLDAQAAAAHEVEAKLVESKQKRNTVTIFQAGHDCWATKKAGDPTIAEDFMNPRVVGKNTVHLRQANIARVQGASQMRQHLRFETRDGKRWGPRFFIFDTCVATIDCIPRMVHDPDNVEDVLKVDSVEGDPFTGDDPYDMARYGLMSRPVIASELLKSKGTTYNQDSLPKRPSWRTV
jgi:phage terminase large subunit